MNLWRVQPPEIVIASDKLPGALIWCMYPIGWGHCPQYSPVSPGRPAHNKRGSHENLQPIRTGLYVSLHYWIENWACQVLVQDLNLGFHQICGGIQVGWSGAEMHKCVSSQGHAFVFFLAQDGHCIKGKDKIQLPARQSQGQDKTTQVQQQAGGQRKLRTHPIPVAGLCLPQLTCLQQMSLNRPQSWSNAW
jgi:hypothetical protein